MRLALLIALTCATAWAQAPDALLERLARHHAYTARHAERTGAYAAYLAERLGLSPEEVAQARLAGRLHDLGKLRVPVAILEHAGKLSAEQWKIIHQHPAHGAELARGAPAAVVAAIANHHERPDGKGYPAGRGEIPKLARIVSIADTFDAVTTRRSYQPPRPFGAALTILRQAAGTQLDRAFVDAFIADEKALKDLRDRQSPD